MDKTQIGAGSKGFSEQNKRCISTLKITYVILKIPKYTEKNSCIDRYSMYQYSD